MRTWWRGVSWPCCEKRWRAGPMPKAAWRAGSPASSTRLSSRRARSIRGNAGARTWTGDAPGGEAAAVQKQDARTSLDAERDLGRVEAFSDGVFAFAATLLAV